MTFLLCVTLLKTMDRLKCLNKVAEPCVLDGGMSWVSMGLKLIFQLHEPTEEHNGFSELSRVENSISVKLGVDCQAFADCCKILQGRRWVGDQTSTLLALAPEVRPGYLYLQPEVIAC